MYIILRFKSNLGWKEAVSGLAKHLRRPSSFHMAREEPLTSHCRHSGLFHSGLTYNARVWCCEGQQLLQTGMNSNFGLLNSHLLLGMPNIWDISTKWVLFVLCHFSPRSVYWCSINAIFETLDVSLACSQNYLCLVEPLQRYWNIHFSKK